MHLPSDLHKEDTIYFIKFIGRQFDLLTGIMETLNICYSFQVFIEYMNFYRKKDSQYNSVALQ